MSGSNFNEQGSTGPPRSGYSPNRAARRRQARQRHRRKSRDHIDSDGTVHHDHHAHHHDGGCYVQIAEYRASDGDASELAILLRGTRAWNVHLKHRLGWTEETTVTLRLSDSAWHCTCGEAFNCSDCGGYESCQHINETMELVARGYGSDAA